MVKGDRVIHMHMIEWGHTSRQLTEEMDDTTRGRKTGPGGRRTANKNLESECRPKRRHEDCGKSRMAVADKDSVFW